MNEVTLFLPSSKYNENMNDYSDFYADSQSYIDALMNYGKIEQQGMPTNFKPKTIKYTKCKCKLFDENKKEIAEQDLNGFVNGKKLIIVEFQPNTADDDFMDELNEWSSENSFWSLSDYKVIPKVKEFHLMVDSKIDLKVLFESGASYIFKDTLLNQKIDKNNYTFLIGEIEKV